MAITKKQQERARRLVSTPEFQLSFRMHAILSHCYPGEQKPFRLQAYRDAGIPELLEEAERKADAAMKRKRRS